MNIAPKDPLLSRLKDELQKLYGERLKQVLLYGSRARGDHREDSDYDVLVVLQSPFDWWEEQRSLSRLSDRLLVETWAELSLQPVSEEGLQRRTGFMHNVRKEAVRI